MCRVFSWFFSDAAVFPAADSGEEGGPPSASPEEDPGEELQESGGAAAEGAGALPADAAPAVPGGHAHAARLLPALSPLREYQPGPVEHQKSSIGRSIASGVRRKSSHWPDVSTAAELELNGSSQVRV